jgi:hypothetical protein
MQSGRHTLLDESSPTVSIISLSFALISSTGVLVHMAAATSTGHLDGRSRRSVSWQMENTFTSTKGRVVLRKGVQKRMMSLFPPGNGLGS